MAKEKKQPQKKEIGRPSKYGEKIKHLQFWCPETKYDLVHSVVSAMLKSYEIKK